MNYFFIDVTDEFVTAQLIVFFAAGFETSSSTISYTLYELAQNHSIQDKVREEIKEIIENDNGAILYDSIKKMTYLHKIFQGKFVFYRNTRSYSHLRSKYYLIESTIRILYFY